MINIVIPMAEEGSRLSKAGYKKPKPFIDVNGIPMIERVIKNLKLPDCRFILIAREDHINKEKELVKELEEKYNAKFISISKDKRGCLIIDAPTISEKKVTTNDLVELISSTEFKWLGRFDSIINSGGIKLIPEQIEEKLSKVISQRFFVAGISDKLLGEKLILIIEGIDNKDILGQIKKLESL